MLKADFHMHTDYSPDSIMSPQSMVDRCVKVGLNCIAVTDHNTVQGALEVQRIAPFRVIIGEEINSTDGEITGLFLSEGIPRDLTPLETAQRIKEQGGLVSIPHPFDSLRRSVITSSALEAIIPYADIVEVFNSRNSWDSANQRAHELAVEHGLLTSGVSDSHTTWELGRTYVEMPDFDGTPEGFKEALAQGTIVAKKTNPLIHVVSTATKLKRRFLGGGRRN